MTVKRRGHDWVLISTEYSQLNELIDQHHGLKMAWDIGQRSYATGIQHQGGSGSLSPNMRSIGGVEDLDRQKYFYYNKIHLVKIYLPSI